VAKGKITVEEVWNPEERFEIAKLMNCSLGQDYIKSEQLLEYITSENAVLYKAHLGKKIVGARIVQLVKPTNIISSFFPKEKELSQLVSIVVEPKFRHQHIGEAMFDAGLKWAKERTKNCVTVSWQEENKEKKDTFLKSKGFSFYRPINQYWYNESIEKNYYCPVCGSPPCTCNGYVYLHNN